MVNIHQLSEQLPQDERIDGLPFGTRGGFVVTHNFPADGEYVFKLRLKRNGTVSTIDGIEEDAHQIEVRIDHALVKRFTIGGKFKGHKGGADVLETSARLLELLSLLQVRRDWTAAAPPRAGVFDCFEVAPHEHHPGARAPVPRRRLERHQGRVGPRVGPASARRHWR